MILAKIAIVTDSTADIPTHLVEKYQIYVIPLTVNVEGQSYLDRVDISNSDFYNYIATAKELPTTSQPSPAQFLEVYKQCKADGFDKILSFHISSDMSGTYRGALMAGNMIKDIIDVHVVDSRSATMGHGLQVVTTAKFLQDNPEVGFDDLMDRIEKMVSSTKIFFLLDSLHNLEKGGRIGKASYLIGSVLNIKPILSVNDGFIHAYEKVRSKKAEKAIDRLSDIICEVIDPGKELYIVLGYNNNEDYVLRLEKNLKKAFPDLNLVHYQIGTAVTTHIGLGAVGAGFYQL